MVSDGIFVCVLVFRLDKLSKFFNLQNGTVIHLNNVYVTHRDLFVTLSRVWALQRILVYLARRFTNFLGLLFEYLAFFEELW